MTEDRWTQSPLTLAALMIGPHSSMSAFIRADNYQVHHPDSKGRTSPSCRLANFTIAPSRIFSRPPVTSKESRRQDRATSGKPGWMQSRMIRMWRILESRKLVLLFPIRDATPVSTVGLAGIVIEDAILNDVIGHADPLIIEQHFDAGGSDPVMRRMAIPVVAAARLSKAIH